MGWEFGENAFVIDVECDNILLIGYVGLLILNCGNVKM